MEFRRAISFVLEAHLPFVREYSKEDKLTHAGEEERFFEYLSETLLPFLDALNRLESDHIPFRLGFVISPVLCHMLCDEHLQNKYLSYLDKQIEFGARELERTAPDAVINKMAKDYYNQIVDRRIAYTERHEKNILKTFDFYKRRGKLEILGSCATNPFLPFLGHNQESLQAQMETPVPIFRRHFGGCSQGFWLPCFGWTEAIEPYLKAYNYSYTIIDSHGLLFGNPSPERGCFSPVRTPNGTYVLARDHSALREIEAMSVDGVYRNNNRDIGYELPQESVSQFQSAEGGRCKTGYKYWAKHSAKTAKHPAGSAVYDSQAACDRAREHAKAFLDNTTARLEEASKYMKEPPVSLFAGNADCFGRFWHEGWNFVEFLFRMASERDVKFLCPSEYIFKQDISSIQIVTPEYSSGGGNGYAQTWLDVSNDWIYRHLYRAMERMTELAERFPDDTGLKERALNQAAREILLAQSSDWPALLYKHDSVEFARSRAESSLRNFTTIYEALGSNYISTEWLTTLERRHNIFPNINYRVFRRKR